FGLKFIPLRKASANLRTAEHTKSSSFLFVGFSLFFLLSVSVFQSCSDGHKKTTRNTNLQSKDFQDKLIVANKMYVRQESDEINNYVKHKGWKMTTTGTGLRYMITNKGNGAAAEVGKYAKVNYKISLLDGTLCYSSDSTGAKVFLIGRDNVETGLHEGIQLLHVGDKAMFILPSHLAHGLMGDDSKIPPKASVIYDIELLSVR
ncbi:MAG: FKBP-type peptidyl-prolyl cis-trans isomerase, partial [Bacteroidetes bacterium]|nr:FKBP-type peptidyl-prolyl cis-trans isomerase [Bacteroidota bacterium]